MGGYFAFTINFVLNSEQLNNLPLFLSTLPHTQSQDNGW